MIILLFLAVVMASSWSPAIGGASDISLIEAMAPARQKPQTQGKTQPKFDPDAQAMEAFLAEEQERIKVIKLLNLDVEKESLELKKKEIHSKMAELKHAPAGIAVTSSEHDREVVKPFLRIMGLTVTQAFKQALLESNGSVYALREGQTFGGGNILKKIEQDQVLVQYADGKEERIFFSGT